MIAASTVRSKLLKESSSADANQANRGVLYAVAVVAALVVAGGDGILYNTEPGATFSPIGRNLRLSHRTHHSHSHPIS
eukprot:6235978-Prymnesium_polylepis.2